LVSFQYFLSGDVERDRINTPDFFYKISHFTYFYLKNETENKFMENCNSERKD